MKLHPEWQITMEQRENALAKWHARREKDLIEHTKKLAPLGVGQVVLVQNQTGNNPRRWNKSGQIVEVLPYDQYRVKLDGTGRCSLRNRRFLRAITPFIKRFDDLPEIVPEIQNAAIGSSEEQQENKILDIPSEVVLGPRRSARKRSSPVRLGISTFTLKELAGGRA